MLKFLSCRTCDVVSVIAAFVLSFATRAQLTSNSAAVILLDVGLERILAVRSWTGVFCPVLDPVEDCCWRLMDSTLLDFVPAGVISWSSFSPPFSESVMFDFKNLGSKNNLQFVTFCNILKST